MKKIKNDWKNHYSVLDEKDRENPFRVLMYFRGIHPLFDTRITLSLLFEAAMSSHNWSRDSPDNRAKMAALYFSLLRLIEACHLIDELWENDKLTYHFGPAKKKR